MSFLRLYLRVIGLLGPERKLAITLALANLALAGVFFLEPVLFGKVVDALSATQGGNAPRLIALWAGVGFAGVLASVWVSLHADRLAHRRRLAAIALFFEHAASMPLSFHGEYHTGRLSRIMNVGVGNLFNLWLSFFREHLATLLSILVMVPVALWINWKLALLMIALLLCFSIFNAVAVQRTHKAQGEVEELHHEIATRAGDVFGNVTVVQSFTRLAAESRALREMMSRTLNAQYPVLRGWAILSVLNRAASTLTIVAIFAVGATLHARGEISVGGIVDGWSSLRPFCPTCFSSRSRYAISSPCSIANRRSPIDRAPSSCRACVARWCSITSVSVMTRCSRRCTISISALRRAAPSRWWVRPALARARRSACSIAPTIPAPVASPSMARTCAR
jgi:ABC-type multidrug transport system fused ATPase/permease subunit